MFLQLWEFTELLRNFRFSFAQKVVEEVQEHNVSVGQLKKISKQPPKLDGPYCSPNQLTTSRLSFVFLFGGFFSG